MTFKKPTRSKYRAVKTVLNGIKYASKLEAKRGIELDLLYKAGRISYLIRQRRYPLSVDGIVIGHYVADFEYFDNDSNMVITEDAKGQRLPLYIWKSKHFEIQYGRKITEITKC